MLISFKAEIDNNHDASQRKKTYSTLFINRRLCEYRLSCTL